MLDQNRSRAIAGLWLGAATVLGLYGLFIASLAVVWTIGSYNNGEISVLELVFKMVFFASFVLGPAVGWALFARRRYWIAMIAGACPIVFVGGHLVLAAGY